jgi:acyl carrier protein phosphodiesterase
VNFLAHVHLADRDPGLMLGGIVADFARNNEVAVLPADVRAGVQLHRLIDGFTDRHPLVQRSISRVSSRLGWFSGIVMDIYFDNILARHWDSYEAVPLPAFAADAYRVIGSQVSVVPPDAQVFIRRLIDNDYLCAYGTEQGLMNTLARVSQRIAERIPKKAMWLPDAMPELLRLDSELGNDFHEFYPELISFARQARGNLVRE